MSEFYFDYRCISLSSKADKNNSKALDFFLFQDYENGAMNVQVYVPSELQKKNNYDRVYIYQNEYGIDFSDLMNGKIKPKVFPMHGSLDAVDRENSFTLTPAESNLSGVGIIAFMRQGSDKPEQDDCFKFAINFSRREIIPYRILEKNKKIVIEIRYPRLLKDIKLRVLHKNNAKPLLIGDKYDERNIVKNKENEPYIIKLEKMGKEFTWKTVKINFAPGTTSTKDYRLFFDNEEDSLFYMLDDESDFVFEDQKERAKELANKTNIFKRNKGVIKCPYCNNPLPKNVINAKSGTYNCHGQLIKNSGIKGIGNGKKSIICYQNLREASNKIIQCENLILPDKSDKLPTMNVAVAGFTRCGKTVYLASVINMFAVDNKTYDANPFILSNITNNFSKKNSKDKSVEMVKMLGYNQDSGQIDYSQEIRRSTTHDTINIKGRYTINVGQEMESHTDATHAIPLAWNPIGFKMGDLGFTYFYDVPGEAFMAKNKTPLRTFAIADGIIAIIDGEKLSASRSAGKQSDSENLNPINNLKDTLEAISELAGNQVDLANMPIAIVFTKLDLKIWQYIDSMDESVKNKCFDDNCHVLREDMISLFPKNRRYRGSPIERHIDCSSYEIQHFLRNLSTEEKDTYEKIIKKYHNIKFFACSSVGSDSVFEKTSSGSGIKRRPRRLRIELPLIWLMHKNGIVRD